MTTIKKNHGQKNQKLSFPADIKSAVLATPTKLKKVSGSLSFAGKTVDILISQKEIALSTALGLAASLGEGWRLPSMLEFETLFCSSGELAAVRDMASSTLSLLSGDIFLWSSTMVDSGVTWEEPNECVASLQGASTDTFTKYAANYALFLKET